MQFSGSLNIFWHCPLRFEIKTDLFQLCGHCWVFHICWHTGAISNSPPLFPSILLDTFQSGGLIFWCHIFLTFHTVRGVLQRRILEWVAICFSSGPCFVRTLQVLLKPSLKDYDPSVLSAPEWHGSWLMASLSYASLFIMTRLFSMKGKIMHRKILT